jgi:hypothetical protein
MATKEVSIGSQGAGPAESKEDHAFGRLHSIRQEAQNLKNYLSKLAESLKSGIPASNPAQFKADLEEIEQLFPHNEKQVRELIGHLQTLMLEDSGLHENLSDSITAIENDLDALKRNWPKQSDPSASLPAKIENVNKLLDDIILTSAKLAIPQRVNKNLYYMWIGETLDFHKTFEWELKDPEHRKSLLEYMFSQKAGINGLIDPDSGRIIKVSRDLRRILAGLLLVVLFPVLMGSLLYLFCSLGYQLPGCPLVPEKTREYLIGYFFIILGALANICVNAIKAARSGRALKYPDLESWGLWLNAREGQLITGVFFLSVGYIALILSGITITFGLAFFAGYSIDNLLDLVIPRFESLASGKSQTLIKDLGKALKT